MKIDALSASRGKTYIDCPNKYFVSYELGIKADAIHLHFGTLVHSVLERWFQFEGEILDLYEEEWRNGTVTDYEYYTDGKEMLLDFESKHNRDNITTISTEHEFNIELAPEQVDKNCPKCFGTGKFITQAEGEEGEEHVCQCYRPAVVVRGFIDRVDEVDSDTIHVTDYKTSRIPLTENEAESDFQLSMYFMAIRKLYPEYKNVILTLYYLRDGVPVTTTRNFDFLEAFEPYVINLFYQIYSDKEHVAKINKYCGWCDGRHQCGAYRNLIEVFPNNPINISELNFVELAKELEHITNSIKILTGRKEEIDSLIREQMKVNDAKSLIIGDKEWYLASGRRSNYTLNSLIKVLPHDWHKCISIRKTEVDKIIGKNDELKNILDNESEYYFISPSLKSKKIKKAKE